jgi:hypothetical protein
LPVELHVEEAATVLFSLDDLAETAADVLGISGDDVAG